MMEYTIDEQVRSNVKELRRILKEIGNFGITNHPLFKKFKHAGTPIFCGALNTSGFLDGFDFSNLVPVGPNALMDVISYTLLQTCIGRISYNHTWIAKSSGRYGRKSHNMHSKKSKRFNP